jgi:hypothetical protein
MQSPPLEAVLCYTAACMTSDNIQQIRKEEKRNRVPKEPHTPILLVSFYIALTKRYTDNLSTFALH